MLNLTLNDHRLHTGKCIFLINKHFQVRDEGYIQWRVIRVQKQYAPAPAPAPAPTPTPTRMRDKVVTRQFRMARATRPKAHSNKSVPSEACFQGLLLSRKGSKLSWGTCSNKHRFELDHITIFFLNSIKLQGPVEIELTEVYCMWILQWYKACNQTEAAWYINYEAYLAMSFFMQPE